MKKTLTLLFLMAFLSSFNVNAQRAALEEIERNLVVVEIGTGTWCGFCPGAAMGADELVENGHPVAIVENHNGDAYTNNYSNARNSFYGITGYPTAFFDGTLSVVGGSASNSMYGSYVPKVNQRMGVNTPFAVDFTFTDNGNDNYTISADISKVGDYSNDVVMHIFVTESHIPENWGGLSELNFVNRLMYPDQNGTALDFSNGDDLTIEHTFDLNSSWVKDNCEFVVAVQDMGTKEILNGAKAFVLQATNDYDAAVNEVLYPEDLACGTEIAPQILIKNYGGVPLTSLDIEYSFNGGDVHTYTWTGEIDFLFSEIVDLPAVAAGLVPGDNTIEVSVDNPNGEEDADMANNETSHEFESLQSGAEVVMESYLGSQYAEELSWALYDPNGNIVAQASYASSNNGQTIEETFSLTETGCHNLVWSDSYGDGFNGGGWCKLYVEGEEIYYFNSFSSEHTTPWFAQIGEPLMPPVDPTATLLDYDILFEWTSPSKATLLGFNIYEEADLENPINEELIEDETYTYTVDDNGQYAFYFTAVYEEGESDMVGPVEVSITVGLNDLASNGVSIYPNPANNYLNIEAISDATSLEVNIYSISGEMVYNSIEENASIIKINTSELDNGIYFVELMIGETKTIQKISIIK